MSRVLITTYGSPVNSSATVTFEITASTHPGWFRKQSTSKKKNEKMKNYKTIYLSIYLLRVRVRVRIYVPAS